MGQILDNINKENDIKKIDDILSKEMEKSVSYIQEMLREDAGNKFIQS